MRTANYRFDRKTRNAVCKASDRMPSLGVWLARIRAIDNPHLTEAVEGIWCGSEGRVTLDMPGTNSMLCMGWYHGKVEWSYVS